MKRIRIILLAMVVIMMSLFLSSCKKEEITIASRVVTKDGNTYIEVDGKPFTYIGIQLRTDAFMNCEYKTASELEPYFQLTSNLNINTIQLPIDWRDIETDEDVYDYSVIKTFLDLALKYNLKVEFLWFSTNMCGETHTYHVPDYIIDDPVKYPRYNSEYTGNFHKYYGYLFHLEFGNDNLLERETKVAKNIMNFVDKWNKENGKPNTLIGIQVHNEPDCFPLWRVGHNQIYVLKDGVQITEDEARAEVNKALDCVGKAFKSTSYKLYTRVNFALANDMNDYIESVFNLEGIDIVGDDPHNSDISVIDYAMNQYSISGNFPHVAENRASFENTNSLILKTISNGGGYIMYEVATSQFFIQNSNGGESDPDYGLYKTDLTLRSHTLGVGKFLKLLNESGYDVVTQKKENFYAFNVDTSSPKKDYEKNVLINGNTYTYKTENGAIGYLINCDNYIIVASTGNSKLSNIPSCSIEKGVFVNGVFNASETIVLDNNTLNLDEYCVYKISFK